MKSNIINRMLIAAAALSVSPALMAQYDVPAAEYGVVVLGNQNVTLENSDAVSMQLTTIARNDVVASSATWLHASCKDGKLVLNVDENPDGAARTAVVALRSAQGVTTEMRVTQPGWDLATAAQATVDAMYVKPVKSKDAAKSSNGKAESGEGLARSYDGDTSTLYHSSYAGFDPAKEEEWPVLEYYFVTDAETPGEEISAITYIPRLTGGENGRFGEVAIEVAHKMDGKNYVWEQMLDELVYDFKKSSGSTTVSIPEAQQKSIYGIRFTVRTGDTNRGDGRNYASIAEMRFHRPQGENVDMALFTDNVCSALKKGTKQADVDKMSDPMLKQLAQMMLDGKYDASERVSTHEAVKKPEDLASEWKSDGKCYDKQQGVTGLALTPGKYVVFVDGISQSLGTVTLRVTYWHGFEQYQTLNDDGSKNTQSYYVYDRDFTVSNGINIIEVPAASVREGHRVDGDEMGLVYINNFDTEGVNNGTATDVTVHVVGALVNGFISNTKTNAENEAILNNAVYPCMDCVGNRVHSVWQTEALKTYSKGQWVRYINILDQLIIWEHRLLGLEKYDRVPANRTCAYVNYNYYMYQGGRGPTFMYDTQGAVCDPDVLMTGNDDMIWGLSHEWGHQHQMAPYFRWTGMAEVTNNIFSAYNVLHMGYPVASDDYRGRYPKNKWQANGTNKQGNIHTIFLDDKWDRTPSEPSEDGETKTANSDGIVMALRTDAANAAKAGNAFWWSKELKQFAQDQPKVPADRSDETSHAQLNAIEAYSGNTAELILAPWINLMFWFSEENAERPAEDYRPDLWADLFEAMRQNDAANGSSIEKSSGIDKYELLLSIHNNNRSDDASINKCEQFRELFPNSVWTTHNYIPENSGLAWNTNSAPAILNCARKLSRLTGYNLWSYFEKFGCYTVCALEQGDYGIQHYAMTQEMWDEFKADMQALEDSGELKPLTEELRKKISYVCAPAFPKPNLPNDRPVLPEDN